MAEQLKGVEQGWSIEGEIIAARSDALTIRLDDGQTFELGSMGQRSLFGNVTFGRVRVRMTVKMLETTEERLAKEENQG